MTTATSTLTREREITIMGLAQALGWKFTAAQYEILCHLTRFIAISGGDRSGKSIFTARWCMVEIVEYLAVMEVAVDTGRLKPTTETILGVVWIIAADYDKTWKEYTELRDDLTRYYGPDAVQATDAVDPGRITLSTPYGKILIRTKSTTKEGSLVMEAPFAIAVVEAAQVSYGAFLRLQGRVAEKRAPILLSGSLEEDIGWYPSLVDRWESPAIWATENSRSWRVPTHTNLFAFPGGENDPEILRIKRTMPEAEFLRRHMGRSSPPKGRVHSTFSMAVHARNIDYREGEVVYLAIDPGIAGPEGAGSSYAIECAHIKREGSLQIQVFDEIHESGKLEEQIIRGILMKREWWGKSPIVGVIDRAGAARAGAHEASIEVYRKIAKLNLLYTEKAIPIQDQIRRFDSFLWVNGITGEPGIVFDTRCEGVLSELGGMLNQKMNPPQLRIYQWEMRSDGTVIGDQPRDRYNDGIKALVYLMVQQFGYATARPVIEGPRHVKYHGEDVDLRVASR